MRWFPRVAHRTDHGDPRESHVLESVRRSYPCQTRTAPVAKVLWSWSGEPEPSKEAAAGAQGLYSTFDAFLKQAIREHYDRGWTTRKGNLHRPAHRLGQDLVWRLRKIRWLTARARKRSRSAPASCSHPDRPALRARRSTRPRAVAAAGASMISYFVRNQKDIVKKVSTYRSSDRGPRQTVRRGSSGLEGWQIPDHRPQPHDRRIDEAFIAQIDEA